MKYWVLVIHDRSSAACTIHRTEDSLYGELDGFVKDNWTAENGWDPADMPESPDARRQEYFDGNERDDYDVFGDVEVQK
jgi:hypothetical protein